MSPKAVDRPRSRLHQLGVAARAEVDAMLRSEGSYGFDSPHLPFKSLFTAFVIGGAIYGLALGSFGGRPLQIIYSAIKVPLFLIVSMLVCLPSFFVLNAVFGLRDDFAIALKAIAAAQSTFAIVLVSLALMTVVFYHSTDDYRLALNYNGLPFLVALLGAHFTLSRHYKPLIKRNSHHRVMLWMWLFLVAFVATQCAWVLRPFVGDPSLEPAFLRPDAWSNGYVEVFDDIAKLTGTD